MRVSIASDTELTPALVAELERSEIKVEETYEQKDLTEQAFGLAELSIVIALIKGAADLARVLKGLLDRSSKNKQKVQIKTAFGSVTLELDKDLTIEELRQKLEPLFGTN